jgi:hypothetical protein
MSVNGHQLLMTAGCRVYFKRASAGGTDYPLHDLGTITECSPTIETEKAEAYDTDGGVRTKLDETIIQIDETWAFTVQNLSPRLLAMALLGEDPEEWTRASTQVVDAVQPAADIHAGYLHQIKDSSGDPVYDITSVDAVKLNDDTGTTEDTDWEAVDLSRGLIRIIDGGSITDSEQIKVTYTPVAKSGLRTVKPQLGQKLEGQFEVWFSADNFGTEMVRRFSGVLSPAGASFGVDEYNTLQFEAAVTSDITDVASPAGTLTHAVGTSPNIS